jgi:glycosyl transferase family 25
MDSKKIEEIMKAYIINLPGSHDRRLYVENVLKPLESIIPQFIEGINGKELSDEKRSEVFDDKGSFRRYGRYLLGGELGCTLSHYKCYQKLIQSNDNYAVIFEDDIILYSDFEESLETVIPYISINKPVIILLSGGFWYFQKKILSKSCLGSVYDAYFTHAYVLNKNAAKLLTNEKPFWLADDWRYLLKKGVTIYGLLPHTVDQNWSGIFTSTVFEGDDARGINKKNMNIVYALYAYLRGFIKKVLAFMGLYEKEYRLKQDSCTTKQ